MRAIIATLSLLTILSLGLFSQNKVYSQPVSEPLPCPHHQKMGAMKEIEKLEISPEQEKALHKLRIKLHKETAPLRTELESKEMELEELWLEDKPDVEKIVKKVQEIHKIRGQIQEQEIRHQFEIYKILKPKQWNLFRKQRGMGFGPVGRDLPPRGRKCAGYE